MADVFLHLSAQDRRDALGVAADRSGRPTHLLEKDVWVVWALATLYAAPLGEHLVFKGGTSLSKAYQVIRRFSEDVDLTYDIRAIAPDLVGNDGEGLPKTRSEEKRWSSEVRRRLPAWVEDTVRPVIVNALTGEGLAAAVRVEGEKLFIDYEATAAGSGYVAPSVMLEFGARSTGEPASLREVICDACWPDRRTDIPGGAIRASCTPSGRSGRRRPPSTSSAYRSGCVETAYARHWHDVSRLDEAGFAEAAFADHELAERCRPPQVDVLRGEGRRSHADRLCGGCQRRLAARARR